MLLLSQEFLSKYPDAPEHMTELGSFVFYRTYSRWLKKEGRRETWKECVARAVNYNVLIAVKEFEKNKFQIPIDKMKIEAETLFDNVFNLRQFLSGRTHWIGGADTQVADKFPLANFNCSFVDVERWTDLSDLFYLLLVGTGVGFRCTKENASLMTPIRTDYELTHSEYKPVPKEARLERTKIEDLGNGYAKIYVGDSKEGWVEALTCFLNLISLDHFKEVKHIKISYNSIRERGEKLETFGGTASGYEPLKEMFEGIDKVFKNQLDNTLAPLEAFEDIYGQEWKIVRPIHILDIGNLIGNNVVVGGVRRTAEMFLCDSDDWECILAKYGINGIWHEEQHYRIIDKLKNLGVDVKWIKDLELDNENIRPLHHRRMSNNSIAFETKPSKEILDVIFEIMQGEGEPGFVNLESAKKRRPNVKGVNPCGEVLLDSNSVCNLTTVNVMAFIKENGTLDYQGLMQAQALSTRAGIRMTCLNLELPHWDKVQKRDRLIGCSLTGWQDAIGKLNYTREQEISLLLFLADVAHSEAIRYCHILRIPTPLLDTTIKPEGTLSQVAGGVSSGLHVSEAEWYIRRIRINANEPLVKVAKSLGWRINPEVGTPGETFEEKMNNARTLVIDFPMHSTAKKTKKDITVEEQFETYFMFQENYTAHNSSNTISVKPDEWDKAKEIVWDKWDDFIGVSFLSYDGGNYELAPYEEITKEQYDELKSQMKPFNAQLLNDVEEIESEKDLDGLAGCDHGVCPIM